MNFLNDQQLSIKYKRGNGVRWFLLFTEKKRRFVHVVCTNVKRCAVVFVARIWISSRREKKSDDIFLNFFF